MELVIKRKGYICIEDTRIFLPIGSTVLVPGEFAYEPMNKAYRPVFIFKNEVTDFTGRKMINSGSIIVLRPYPGVVGEIVRKIMKFCIEQLEIKTAGAVNIDGRVCAMHPGTLVEVPDGDKNKHYFTFIHNFTGKEYKIHAICLNADLVMKKIEEIKKHC